jgi:hypothetical protein
VKLWAQDEPVKRKTVVSGELEQTVGSSNERKCYHNASFEEKLSLSGRNCFTFLTAIIDVCRYNSWLWAGLLRGWSSSPGRVKNFHFSMSCRLALVITQPPIQWVPGG